MGKTQQLGTRQIEAGLHRLERRRRRLSIAAGIGAWLGIVLPAAAALCLLDWYPPGHVPLVVRWAGTLGLIGLGWLAWRRFVRPALSTRHVVDQTALTVERRFPELADRVISAVQLDRHGGDPGYGSAELIAATQQQAVEWSGRVSFAQALPLARSLPLLLTGVAVLLAAVGAAVLHPRIVGTWAVRCFWQADYPSKTRIVNCPTRLLAARGESAVIVVDADGVLLPASGRVRLTSRSSANSGSIVCDLLREEGSASQGNQGNRYVARVEQVVEPLEFRVELGDAPPATGRIDVADRPDIAEIRADLTYPPYVGGLVKPVHSGHLSALPGTRVRLTIWSSKPLGSAQLGFDGAGSIEMSPDGSAGGPGGSAVAAGAWSASFDITADTGYTINLVDQDGLGNLSPVHYKVTAVQDALPRVTLVRPGAEALATPASRVHIEYVITDDYGLRAGRLKFRVNEDKQFREGFPLVMLAPAYSQSPGSTGSTGSQTRVPPAITVLGEKWAGPLGSIPTSQPDPATQPEADMAAVRSAVQTPAVPGPLEAHYTIVWDLSPLGLKVGDVVTYRLTAHDHAPRADKDSGGKPTATSGQSPDREIRIVDEAAIAKQLQEQWRSAVDEIERSAVLLQGSQEKVRQIERELTGRNSPTTTPAGETGPTTRKE